MPESAEDLLAQYAVSYDEVKAQHAAIKRVLEKADNKCTGPKRDASWEGEPRCHGLAQDPGRMCDWCRTNLRPVAVAYRAAKQARGVLRRRLLLMGRRLEAERVARLVPDGGADA